MLFLHDAPLTKTDGKDRSINKNNTRAITPIFLSFHTRYQLTPCCHLMSFYNLLPTLPFRLSLSFLFFLNSNLLLHFILDMGLVHETIMFCIIRMFVPPAPFFSWRLVEGDILHLNAQDCGLIRYRFQSVPFFYTFRSTPSRIILYLIFFQLLH